MAILNVRVDDQVRDRLKTLADDDGVSLSEYIRNLLMEAVMPVHEPEGKHGDEPPPDSMRILDRQVLSLLHRILGRVLPEDANDVDGDAAYQLERAEILEEGFVGEYWREVAGFRTELSKRDCGRVSDILQMFRIIRFSVNQLATAGVRLPDEMALGLEFRGFDHNDALEGHMADYVRHQMRDGRWSELQEQIERNDRGNSHAPMLGVYTRMLTEYRRIMNSRQQGFGQHDYLLSLEELRQIADALTHPSRRPDDAHQDIHRLDRRRGDEQ